MDKLAVVLHGAHGVEVVKQVAKLAYGIGAGLFVLSKPTSAAAQTAVPEVGKLAFKQGKGFLVVPDINDVLELLSPVKALFFIEGGRGEMFDEGEVVEGLRKGYVALFFSAAEPGFSMKELEGRRVVSLRLPGEVGCVATASIALFKVWLKFIGVGEAHPQAWLS